MPFLPSLLAAMAFALSLLATPARAGDAALQALADRIARTEARLDARIGVYLLDGGTGWHWGHRASERFLMASTFKALLCAAVLERADAGTLSLDERLPVRADQIHGHAPVTRPRAGAAMRIDDLCRATLDQSDNGAANLLVDRLGGTGAVTDFLRRAGDPVTRLDRKEPDLNIFAPGDPRDTTSPGAMATTWQRMLTGDLLSPGSRARLAGWMAPGGVTGALIRPHLPPGWAISDRSGGGRQHTRAITAMITPPGRAPWFVAIYLSDTPADWNRRNAAVSALGAAAVAVIAADPGGRP
ncbi:MAG: class A beta-lactamase [Paracoccaceae bacterium]|nr:MAG: class A beta-lactamase [Paracoccaceae bacterium]